jgi:DNA-binding winged helix-turn-helix (wHTH) protein
MQIHILDEVGQDLSPIENAIRRREVAIRRAEAAKPIERIYKFAEWTLNETVRDLIGPAGQRVDLTSSEFDLLMAFLRQPGQPLSRGALLGVLRRRQWTYFDRSIDTLVARLRKKLTDGSDRPPLIRSVRAVGYVFCAAVSALGDQDRSGAAARLAGLEPGAVPRAEASWGGGKAPAPGCSTPQAFSLRREA